MTCSCHDSDSHDSDTASDTDWQQRYRRLFDVKAATVEESLIKNEKLKEMCRRTNHTPPYILQKRNRWSKELHEQKQLDKI